MTDLIQRARDVAGRLKQHVPYGNDLSLVAGSEYDDHPCEYGYASRIVELYNFATEQAAIIAELIERIEGLEREVDFLNSSFLDERD